MKTITMVCAILWAVTTLFHLYGITIGDYPISDIFLESPIDAMETLLWFFADAATATFFYILWTKQS